MTTIFVFPDRSGTKPYGGLKKVWRQIREQTGLDDVRMHDLRHSYASIAVAGGASLFVVGKVLGHNDPATTKRYAHIARDPIKLAADEISLEISGHLLRIHSTLTLVCLTTKLCYQIIWP